MENTPTHINKPIQCNRIFVGLIIGIVLIASNKTLTGDSYLYPLIPLDWKALKALIFRVRLVPKQKRNNKNLLIFLNFHLINNI